MAVTYFWPHPAVLRVYFRLCAQESLLVELGGPYEVLGIEKEDGSDVSKASALSAVLSLWPWQ